MRAKVVKWGNSLGLRIPKSFAEDLRIVDGTLVDLVMDGDQLVIRTVPDREWSLDDLLAGVTQANRHAATDTGGPVGGEAW